MGGLRGGRLVRGREVTRVCGYGRGGGLITRRPSLKLLTIHLATIFGETLAIHEVTPGRTLLRGSPLRDATLVRIVGSSGARRIGGLVTGEVGLCGARRGEQKKHAPQDPKAEVQFDSHFSSDVGGRDRSK